MTRAADIVAIQAGLIDEFYRPHPDRPRLNYGSHRVGGDELIVPRSKMSELADTMAMGVSPEVQGQSVAPLIVHGLKRGRAYRVQENMTEVVSARARELPDNTRAIIDIQPPRPNGFAWFDEPIPAFRDDPEERGYSAISWTSAVDKFPDDGTAAVSYEDVHQIGLSFLITFWADLHHRAWRSSSGITAPHTALFPVTVRSMYAGDRVRGLWQARLAQHVEFEIDTPLVLRPERIALALWQLLGETIPAPPGSRVDRDDEHVPRSTERRARNLGMQEPGVTTVVLRREARPTLHPGTGTPMSSRVWIEPYKARRWVGPRHDRRLVVRTIGGHWSNNDLSLPERKRIVVSELRR
jgi:hypothetical protein